MKYYGLIENLTYGFVEEDDNRITDKFIEITDEYHQQLLDEQSQGLEIISDNKTVFTAKPNLYFVNSQGLWEKKNEEDYEAEQAQKEKERIQELFMTKSDFFDGTIAAWGADKTDLKPIIEQTLALLPLDDVTKKKALNNYENAQNFYRKHTLFTLLSNRTLKLNDTMQVFVTDEHWDKFFDETDKKNPLAYKELPTPETIQVEEETEEVE